MLIRKAAEMSLRGAVIASTCWFAWSGWVRAGAGDPTVPAQRLSPAMVLDGLPTQGNAGANVAIVVFSDFQCPYCRQFSNLVLPDLRRLYVDTGKVRLVFRHLPLDGLHPAASLLAAAAECGHRQKRFWELHDLLFETPAEVDEPHVLRLAASAALDLPSFGRCLETDGPKAVSADRVAAAAAGVDLTPTFLVGRVGSANRLEIVRIISGMAPLSRWMAVLTPVLD